MNDLAHYISQYRRVNRAPNRLLASDVERIVGTSIENATDFSGLSGLSTLDVLGNECLVFRDRYDERDIEAINAFAGSSSLFILPPEYRNRVQVPTIFIQHPRDAFIPLTIALFDYYGDYWLGFEEGSVAASRFMDARIMQGSYIHPTASIGAGTVVFPGAVIGPRVTVGRNVLVKPHAVIGLWGYGIHVGESRKNIHLPHVGGVVIGDDVELGALITVCSGTVHPTIVADNVKIDDHAHISHNVTIDLGSQIIAHAEVSGSTAIGKFAVLSPNCSTINGTKIGDGAIVGIAANVTKDVAPRTVVIGNPARFLREI